MTTTASRSVKRKNANNFPSIYFVYQGSDEWRRRRRQRKTTTTRVRKTKTKKRCNKDKQTKQ